MHVSILPVFFCTLIIVCLWPLLSRWLSPRYVLLFFSLGCFALISMAGLVVLLAFSVIVFAGGNVVDRSRGRATFYLIIAGCLLPLILYKILDARTGSNVNTLITVVGISYFTFNGLSYLFDVRKGYLVPETNYAHLLLYLSFFPCIAAGPLHRYKYLDAQFSNALKPDSENLSRGFRLVLWGLFKNLVLAQRLKSITDSILDNPDGYQGLFVVLGGLMFCLQLYCDFSSYVDMGMGFSRMVGIQLTQNFSNRVYASSSRTEFWKGWHQTLNGWFRDYFFFPLAKGRTNAGRLDLLLLLTFVFIGLWHEISYRFLLWGLLNGLWILIETKAVARLPDLSSRAWKGIGVLYHLTIASFMGVIFRTNNLPASWQALSSASKQQFTDDAMARRFIVIIPLFLAMDQLNRVMKDDSVDVYLGRQKLWHRWAIYFALALVIMTFGQLPGENHYYTRF